MKFNQILISISLASILFIACETEKKAKNNSFQYLDKNIAPKDDFFKFVNGKWLETAVIPDDQTSWGSFNELRKKTDESALAILKEASTNGKYNSNTDQGKAINYYKSIMDTISRNEQGIKPLEPYLAKIDAIQNIHDLEKLMIEMEPLGGLGFFGFWVGSHPKKSDENAVFIWGGGLGLPDRGYYVEEDDDSKSKRDKYVNHVSKMLQFIGEDKETSEINAKKVLAFETMLATAMLTKEERRDPQNRYNPRSIGDLQKLSSSFQWKNYFNTIGIQKLDTVIVTDVNYMKQLENTLKITKVDDWKNYLRWRLIDRGASRLSTDIDYANWEFYSKELRGAKKQKKLEERALSIINGSLGEALGKLYVEKNFPPEAKKQAKEMVYNVIEAFKQRINTLEWMTAETKEKAKEKLGKMSVKIGYPDNWKDYSKLNIKPISKGGTLFDNALELNRWNFQKDLDKIGKPVDKSEWLMAPQVVNAYFMPPYNEIVFPAAILQPPFFDHKADAAVNYGGIGAVIGHEISHSFDDKGSMYDGDGNLKNWWTEEDMNKFKILGKKLDDQYSAVEALPGIFLNGTYTLGENIGDLGGINAAYDGLQIHLKNHGPVEKIDGYTPEQRLFMSWATIWRTIMEEETLKYYIKTNTHSPGEYRAYMPLQNVDNFYEAFNIKQGDGMYLAPEERVKIW